jgi:hypothetical protein
MIRDNVLDSLFKIDDDEEEVEDIIFSDQSFIPKKCATCKTAVVCSVVPNFLNLSKIKIYISVDQCPFNQPRKNVTKKSEKT